MAQLATTWIGAFRQGSQGEQHQVKASSYLVRNPLEGEERNAFCRPGTHDHHHHQAQVHHRDANLTRVLASQASQAEGPSVDGQGPVTESIAPPPVVVTPPANIPSLGERDEQMSCCWKERGFWRRF
jgi:hypothetical protein